MTEGEDVIDPAQIEKDVTDHLRADIVRRVNACRYGWISYIPHRIKVRFSHWYHCSILWIWCRAGLLLSKHPDMRPLEKQFIIFSIREFGELQRQHGEALAKHVAPMCDEAKAMRQRQIEGRA